jgi:hypothetical protein
MTADRESRILSQKWQMSGTMLSDLGQGTPDNSDGDFVQRILADLNTSESASNPVMNNMPPPAGNGRVINSPNPNTTYPLAMDPATATAHMIGKDFPTAGDFSTMMNQSSGAPYQQGQQQQQQQQQQQAPILTQLSTGKGYVNDLIHQMRQPLLVAIIFFIVSLPVINVLIGHYLPSMLRAGGDLTTVGLLVKSLGAGAAYWVILNVLVPLVSS